MRSAADRMLFTAWSATLAARLRRHGGRVTVDAPHGARLASPPLLDVATWGRDGDARLTLRIGRNVRLGRRVVLEVYPGATSVLELGDDTVLGDGVRLQLRGGAIRMGPNCRMRAGVMLKADGELVFHGGNELSYGAVVHCAERIEFGVNAGAGERISVLDSDHTADGSDTYFYEQPLRIDPVTIGPNVFLAANTVITRGTRIGANSFVGASSVLTGGREYPEGSLIAGAPAKVVRQLSSER